MRFPVEIIESQLFAAEYLQRRDRRNIQIFAGDMSYTFLLSNLCSALCAKTDAFL
jgi:hypothetical protein